MDISLIFKIAAVGIIVSVVGQILKHSGREEQAFLTSLAGLILVFKSIKPEYGIMISVVGCAFIFLYSLVRVNEIVEMVERLAGITSVSREYIKIILKITGVTFISEIASDIAKDCGYQAVANQVQIFGKLSVLVISFPVFTELISSIGKLLS